MVTTRAQSAPLQGHASLTPKDQGKRPNSIPEQRRTPQLPKHLKGHHHPQVSNFRAIASPKGSAAGKRGTKRSLDASDHDSNSPPQKRPRPSSGFTFVEDCIDSPANNYSSKPTNPIHFWALEGRWPKEYFESRMEHLFPRKRSRKSLIRKRSNSTASMMTPSDQKPREMKSVPYQSSDYEDLLQAQGCFMKESKLGITTSSKTLCATLLERKCSVPEVSLFHDDFFESTCEKIQDRNEARVVQDISRLIVPSAESLATFGDTHLDILTESVDERWNRSIPLLRINPQPDYSVGFRKDAFSEDQFSKLSPYVGVIPDGDLSPFMATKYMFFPFLTCEVKCSAAALVIADRQNAYSMAHAVRGVVELFRLVKREAEINREILAFSVSHNHKSVQIFGHYPVIVRKKTEYYRHLLHDFSLVALGGKEKWTSYRFIRSVYDSWMPSHLARICSAIDQLPADLNLDSPSLPSTTALSLGLENEP